MSNKGLIEFTQASYLDCEKYDALYREMQQLTLKYNCDLAGLSLVKLEDAKIYFQSAVYHWAEKSQVEAERD